MLEDFRSVVIRSSAVNVVVSFGWRALLLLQSVLYARVFTPGDLGQVATVLLVFSFVTLVSQMGFQESIILENKSPAAAMNTALTLALIVGGGLFCTVFLTAPFLAMVFQRPEAKEHIRFMSFMVFGSALGLPYSLWIKHFKFGIAKVGPCVDLLFSTTVTLLVYFNTEAGIWSLFVGRLAGFVARYTTVWMLAPYRPRCEFDRGYAVAFYQFGWPLVVHSLCNYLVHNGDDILIRYFWGDESLAYYTLAFALPFYLKDFTDLLLSSLLPVYSHLRESHEKTVAAFIQTNRYLTAVVLPCGIAIAVFADPLILLIFGTNWAPAAFPLKLLALGFTVNLMTGYSWGVLVLASGKTKRLMYLNLWVVLYLMTVGAYLIQKFGVLGGAYYTFSEAVLTDGVIRNWFLYRDLGNFSFLKDTLKSLVASLIPGGVITAFIAVFITNLSMLLLVGGAYFIVYALLFIFLDRSIVIEAKQIVRVLIGSRYLGQEI